MRIRDGNIPTGKGTFIWLLPRLVELFGSAMALVGQLKDDGYQWVCIKAQEGNQLGTGYNDNQEEFLDEFCPLAEAAGIEVHGWGYNYGETTTYRKLNKWNDKEVSRIVEALLRWKFRSWMLNAEVEFKVKGGRTAAVSLVNAVREALSTNPNNIDVPVGISSFRFVSSHPEFPFLEFLNGCDFAAPQVYWQKSNYPVWQLEKSVAEWKAVKDLPQVVAGTVYPEGEWWPTGDQLLAFNERAKEMPEVVGVNYWEHYYPFKYKRADLVAALAEFDWPSEKEEEKKRPTLSPELVRKYREMLSRMK